MGIAVTFVMVLATAATWPIMQLLLKFELGYLQTVVFILVIAALVQLVEMFMKKSMPALYKSLGVFLPLITTNCAVLGVCIKNIETTCCRTPWSSPTSGWWSRSWRSSPGRIGTISRSTAATAVCIWC